MSYHKSVVFIQTHRNAFFYLSITMTGVIIHKAVFLLNSSIYLQHERHRKTTNSICSNTITKRIHYVAHAFNIWAKMGLSLPNEILLISILNFNFRNTSSLSVCQHVRALTSFSCCIIMWGKKFHSFSSSLNLSHSTNWQYSKVKLS